MHTHSDDALSDRISLIKSCNLARGDTCLRLLPFDHLHGHGFGWAKQAPEITCGSLPWFAGAAGWHAWEDNCRARRLVFIASAYLVKSFSLA